MNSFSYSNTRKYKLKQKPDFQNNEHIIHSKTNSNFNTYTNVDYWQNCVKTIRPKSEIPQKKFKQFHTFLRTSAPFNYFSGKDSYIIHYNGGLVRELRPLVSRQDLSKYLRCNSFLIKSNKQKSLSNYKLNNISSKPHRIRNCSCFFRKNNKKIKSSNQDENFLGNRQNNLMSSKTYKLKNNNDINENNRYEMFEESKNEKSKINMKRRNLSDSEQMLQFKREQILNNFNSSSYTIRPKNVRNFHKAQILNNYKPFLIDQFREFADYS